MGLEVRDLLLCRRPQSKPSSFASLTFSLFNQPRPKNLHAHALPLGTHGLGARCSLGPHPAAEIIHRIRVAGQDGADLDFNFFFLGPDGGRVVDVQHGVAVRCRGLARKLELERQRAGGLRRG